MNTNDAGEVEILGEEIELDVRITAKETRPLGLNPDGWEETPGLGYYLGDGVYEK